MAPTEMAPSEARRATWATMAALAPALTSADRAMLGYLGTLPWLTAPHLTAIAGLVAVWPVRARLTRLRRQGLVQALPARAISQVARQATQRWPDGRDDATVWALTDAGLAALAWLHGTEPRAIAATHGLTGARLTALLLALPTVSAGYELLAAVCRSRPGRPLIRDWAQPWPARPVWTLPRQPGRLAQPAAVTLAWTDDGTTMREAVRAWLVPDIGALPLAALAPVLRRIRRAPAATAEPPTVLVATTDRERQHAWRARLAALPHPAVVLTWAEVGDGQLRLPAARADDDHQRAASPLWTPWRPVQQQRPVPRLIDTDPGACAGVPAVTLARTGVTLPRPAREALLLLAAHPFLPLATWAQLRGQTEAPFRARSVRPLLAAGFVRQLTASEVPDGAVDGAPVDHLHLMEATASGLAVVAAQAGVGLPAAVRWAGWAGGGPAAPVGARRPLLATLAHTLGVYRLLAALHAPLAAHRFAPDDALLDWLPGTARRWPGIRPDAFGCIRHLGREYPFFLEYEHGGNPMAQVTAKLLAYERYVLRDGPARAGLGQMPPVLLVAADDAGETHLAGLAAALWPDPATAVPLLLAAEGHLLADDAGWLGRVWRSAWSGTRRYWPWEVERAVRRQQLT